MEFVPPEERVGHQEADVRHPIVGQVHDVPRHGVADGADVAERDDLPERAGRGRLLGSYRRQGAQKEGKEPSHATTVAAMARRAIPSIR